jgi:hypothetical protein
MARACKVSKGDAFYGWFKLWSYFDETTSDGFVHLLTCEDVDEVAGIKGAGRALSEAGWLEFHKHGCTVLRWDRHNGQSAKSRCQSAERMGRLRKERNKCNAESVTKA